MQQGYTEASANIAATAADIYDVLADYRHGHPHILPQPYFSKIEVEEGGTGSGTIIRIHMRVFGQERVFRQRVSEPDPGRVLVETDLDTGSVTTFTVTSLADEQQSHVHIATEWIARPGIIGWLERLMTTRLLRSIYTKELQQLAAYVTGGRSFASNRARDTHGV